MEVNHLRVVVVEPGEEVALKVVEPVREQDRLYRVTRDVMDLQVL
jgi:hypothetical protein